jgi:hypothetical protein
MAEPVDLEDQVCTALRTARFEITTDGNPATTTERALRGVWALEVILHNHRQARGRRLCAQCITVSWPCQTYEFAYAELMVLAYGPLDRPVDGEGDDGGHR